MEDPAEACVRRIAQVTCDEVRDRTDISAVIGRHVHLERRDSGFVGSCPFSPTCGRSLHVVPRKGMYYCFGCASGGDVFRFLMLVEHLSFEDAVRRLAAEARIEVVEVEVGEGRPIAQGRDVD